MTNAPATFDVVAIRTFDASAEQVWEAWRDPALVMRWWGPAGFTCPLASMDFRVGGTSLVCMRAPQEFGGQDFYNTWTYTRLVPHERVEFTLRFSDDAGNPLDPTALGLPPGIPASVPHIITFRPVARGQTEMTVTELGYASPETRDQSLAGLEQCLDKMALLFGVR
jgi:uncharacterized protein YndB with AHSA1/START domain